MDYRYFFIIGLSYLIVGITVSFAFQGDVSHFNFFVFMVMIFTAMGLANTDNWKKMTEANEAGNSLTILALHL